MRGGFPVWAISARLLEKSTLKCFRERPSRCNIQNDFRGVVRIRCSKPLVGALRMAAGQISLVFTAVPRFVAARWRPLWEPFGWMMGSPRRLSPVQVLSLPISRTSTSSVRRCETLLTCLFHLKPFLHNRVCVRWVHAEASVWKDPNYRGSTNFHLRF